MPDRPRSTPREDFRAPGIVIHNSLASNLPHRHSPLAADLSNRPHPTPAPPRVPSNGAEPLRSNRSSSFSSHAGASTPWPSTLSGSPSTRTMTSPLLRPRANTKERTRSSSSHGPREMVYVDSKEGLSEMVTNIRGISNSLANVTLAVSVQNVLVVAKMTDDKLPADAHEMVEWLLQWEHEKDGLHSADSRLELAVPPRRRSCEVNAEMIARRQSRAKRRDSDLTIKVRPDDSRRAMGGEAGDSGLADRADRLTELLASSVSLSEDAVLEEPYFHPERPVTGCSSQPLTVYVEEQFAAKPEFELAKLTENLDESAARRLKFWTTEDHLDAEEIDLVITLGGDGTVLYTSWLFQKMVPPTLSFGMGSLGFMTENSFEEYPHVLEEHLNSGICCALRMRFECTVMRTRNQNQSGSDDLERELHDLGQSYHSLTHTRDGEYTILNEVVVDRGPNPFVTMTELYGNFELLTSIKADGVVISTPTGSTAYSMSAGGSLVHPDISARLISPICPHTLSFRPLVVPDSMVLHIGVPYDARSSAFVSFDGKARVELRRGDFLAINASPYPFPKVLPQENSSVSWVQQLSRTLHWNEQKRPKRYTDGSHDKLN